jgi:signal transduction histidine kinase/ActR/RegA family two-component response regulator
MFRKDDRLASGVDVLLVDRQATSVPVLANITQELGATLLQVASPEEALRPCRERNIALVFVVPRQGNELSTITSRLAERCPPVIVLAPPDAPESQAQQAYADGAVDFLRLPLSAPAVRAKLKVFMRLREVAPANPEGDRLRDEFLAMLGHELRNPLAPLGNAVQILRQTGTKGALADQTLDLMERQFRHLTRLVDDLLDVSRLTRGKIVLKKETVELNQAIAHVTEVVRPLGLERGLQLAVHTADQPVYILADPSRLEQVFENLLLNAIRFTESGGEVQLSVERDGDHAIMRIKDTGIGIRPEMLPRIFELFAQADRAPDRPQEGLGIGLTLVRRLVELHDGSIEAASAGLGSGSEFIVRFPVQMEAPPAEPLAQRYVLPSARLLRILVVEDNQDTARSLANVLRLWGHEVRIAYDGPSALEIGQAFLPEVVFLDIGLPRGMDGYEVALRLREHPELEKCRIVALTGFGQPEDRRRALAAGFDLHLTKPVHADELRRMLAAEAAAAQTKTA